MLFPSKPKPERKRWKLDPQSDITALEVLRICELMHMTHLSYDDQAALIKEWGVERHFKIWESSN